MAVSDLFLVFDWGMVSILVEVAGAYWPQVSTVLWGACLPQDLSVLMTRPGGVNAMYSGAELEFSVRVVLIINIKHR